MQIAVGKHFHRGVNVLGDRFRGDSADRSDGVAAKHGAGAATEGAVPGVAQARITSNHSRSLSCITLASSRFTWNMSGL